MTNSTESQPFVFELDFTEIELTRQAEVRRALEDDYDEIAAMEQEELAYRMLFANLDDHQRAVYAELVRAGVLPAREGDVDAG
ncbi:MAG TPA: DUF6400 family protein [Pseudonocardiaceae bacterium]